MGIAAINNTNATVASCNSSWGLLLLRASFIILKEFINTNDDDGGPYLYCVVIRDINKDYFHRQLVVNGAAAWVW